MKPIKAISGNYAKINKALVFAEEKCSVRTVLTSEVFSAVDEIEKQLSQVLYKKDWVGLKFQIDPNAQTFPGAYKGTPESTIIAIEYKKTSWFVTDIFRGRCTNRSCTTLGLQDKQEQLVSFLTTKISI